VDDANKSKPTNGTSTNGDKANGDAEHDESDDENEGEEGAPEAGEGAAKKKKKRKPRKKKKAGAASGPKTQTSPPRVPVHEIFLNDSYPEGEICEYLDENSYRTTSEEKRHLDRMNNDFLTDYRRGAEVHRQVRQWARNWIKPGMSLTEIAEGIEDSVRSLTGHQGLEDGDGQIAGMGFPTGLSINHCAAHYTPNAGNKMVVNYEDVMKVDFGVHTLSTTTLSKPARLPQMPVLRKLVLMSGCQISARRSRKSWRATRLRSRARCCPSSAFAT
jgi:methionyl aminopeptidase